MFYADPSQESSRIQNILQKYEVLKKTQPNVYQKRKELFQVFKCWNDNFVSYSFDMNKNSIKTEWISLEPKDRERHESEGNWSLKNDLNTNEEEIFGCTVEVIEGNRYIVRLNIKQLKDRSNELVIDENDEAIILGTVNGKLCKLLYAYAQMKNSMIPEIDYVNLYGMSLNKGELCCEKIYEKV